MSDSYTTDNRVQRVVSRDILTETATGVNAQSHTHDLGVTPYFRFYTKYPDDTVIIGAPFGHYPDYVGVQMTTNTTDVTYTIETYTAGDVIIYSRIYTEVS
jgi:hypothetical protein